jgi:RimJ/RimL family protein N-acetyltransferase
MIVETSRLLLREFRRDDADALALVISDPEIMRFYPAPFDRAGVEQWIERNLRRYAEHGHGLWGMVLKSSGDLIGDCGLTLQNVDSPTNSKSVITCAAICGDRAWPRRPLAPAAIMGSAAYLRRESSRRFAVKTCPRGAWRRKMV